MDQGVDEVYCSTCSKAIKPVNAYKIFLDEIAEIPWSKGMGERGGGV